MNNKASTRKRAFPWIPVLVTIVGIGVILAASGFTFAASQETHDPFCASCHTQPESTFVQRSTAQPVDLASFHTTQKTRCIDCHSGSGLFGRMQAELLGARNATTWYMGIAAQPARLIFPIHDGNCLKCPQDVVQAGFVPKANLPVPGGEGGGFGGGEREGGRMNHWHQFLARWQSADPNAGSCTTCHAGHLTGSTVQAGFMDAPTISQTCDACHQVLRRGREGGG